MLEWRHECQKWHLIQQPEKSTAKTEVFERAGKSLPQCSFKIFISENELVLLEDQMNKQASWLRREFVPCPLSQESCRGLGAKWWFNLAVLCVTFKRLLYSRIVNSRQNQSSPEVYLFNQKLIVLCNFFFFFCVGFVQVVYKMFCRVCKEGD